MKIDTNLVNQRKWSKMLLFKRLSFSILTAIFWNYTYIITFRILKIISWITAFYFICASLSKKKSVHTDFTFPLLYPNKISAKIYVFVYWRANEVNCCSSNQYKQTMFLYNMYIQVNSINKLKYIQFKNQYTQTMFIHWDYKINQYINIVCVYWFFV